MPRAVATIGRRGTRCPIVAAATNSTRNGFLARRARHTPLTATHCRDRCLSQNSKHGQPGKPPENRVEVGIQHRIEDVDEMGRELDRLSAVGAFTLRTIWGFHCNGPEAADLTEQVESVKTDLRKGATGRPSSLSLLWQKTLQFVSYFAWVGTT